MISVSAPAFSKALAESNSQFVPGNTGITTFGFATLIAGVLGCFSQYRGQLRASFREAL